MDYYLEPDDDYDDYDDHEHIEIDPIDITPWYISNHDEILDLYENLIDYTQNNGYNLLDKCNIEDFTQFIEKFV